MLVWSDFGKFFDTDLVGLASKICKYRTIFRSSRERSWHFGNQLLQLRHRYTTISKNNKMKFLNQEEAINIDVELFNQYKYSLDQLMELAGLSCAHAVAKCYRQSEVKKRILVCCGPGNNGGDGLVCARHLAILGYKCTIYYPKRTDKELYRNLVVQCNSFGDAINFIETSPSSDADYSIIVDALFGFSFNPPVREMFLPIIRVLEKAMVPIVRLVLIWNET